MALFTGKDRDLPLLTQVYQLDLEDEEEAARFIESQEKPSQGMPRFSTTARQAAKPLTIEVHLLSHTANIVRPMMLSLVTLGGVEVELMGRFVESLNLSYGTLVVYSQEAAFIPLNAVRFIENDMLDLSTRVLLALRDAAWRMQQDSTFLSPCEECLNIFERSRVGQRFCSDRCRSRSRKRRQRSKDKENRSRLNPQSSGA